MQLEGGGKTMCKRLPPEICDRIYEYAWSPTSDLSDNPSRTGLSYPELVELTQFDSPGSMIIHTPLARWWKFFDPQLAAELVEWLYKNVDLGLLALGRKGIHVRTPMMPPVVARASDHWDHDLTPEVAEALYLPAEARENFPFLKAGQVQKVLDMDLFGVGVKSSDCNLRNLSVLVDYLPTYKNPIFPFKQSLTCAAMDTLVAHITSQAKTENFKLHVFTTSWESDDIWDLYSVAGCLRALRNKITYVRTEIARQGVHVEAPYFQYAYESHVPQSRWVLTAATDSKDLARAADWDAHSTVAQWKWEDIEESMRKRALEESSEEESFRGGGLSNARSRWHGMDGTL